MDVPKRAKTETYTSYHEEEDKDTIKWANVETINEWKGLEEENWKIICILWQNLNEEKITEKGGN